MYFNVSPKSPVCPPAPAEAEVVDQAWQEVTSVLLEQLPLLGQLLPSDLLASCLQGPPSHPGWHQGQRFENFQGLVSRTSLFFAPHHPLDWSCVPASERCCYFLQNCRGELTCFRIAAMATFLEGGGGRGFGSLGELSACFKIPFVCCSS